MMEPVGKYITRKLGDIGSVIYRKIVFPFVKIGMERKYDSIICKGAYLNKGTVLEGKDYIGNGTELSNVSLGFSSYIGPGSHISNTRIGRYSCIAGLETAIGRHPVKGENVSVHPAFYSTAKQYGFTYVDVDKFEEVRFAGGTHGINISIGSDVWIGREVLAVDGVTIGDGAVIGARSLVLTDVEPYAIYAGSPARKVGMRFDEETVSVLLKLRWWDRDRKWIEEHAGEFSDINKIKEW